MIRAWQKQVRQVAVLQRAGHLAARGEQDRKQALRRYVEDTWLRTETLLWVAVTGAIWWSRRRDLEKEERGNLLAELLASAWIMQRWRQLAAKARSMTQ
jgi:hypothetical protein